jgi:signal transduction histidine kinase
MFYILLKNRNNNEKVIIFTIISIICGISYGNNPLIYIFITNICYSLLSIIIVEFIKRSEKLINIHGTVRQVQDEKIFRDSLFKVTHEIKNPIAVCKGYLDMMDTNNTKQMNKYVPIIRQEIERTLTLMNDFLSLTKLKVDKKNIDITLLLDDLCSCVESLLIEKNMHFIYDISNTDIYIEGDYDRIKQVLMNLIKNSVESIQKGKIGIIKLKMILKKDKICIILEDNGIGMNREILKRIGEPFFTTKKNGTGLGIKMCKEIIELHNGEIKFSSKVNIGTIVTIELPIKK